MSFVSIKFEIKENYCFKLHAGLAINFHVSIDTFGYRTVTLYPVSNCFHSISTGKLTQGVGLETYKLLESFRSEFTANL